MNQSAPILSVKAHAHLEFLVDRCVGRNIHRQEKRELPHTVILLAINFIRPKLCISNESTKNIPATVLMSFYTWQQFFISEKKSYMNNIFSVGWGQKENFHFSSTSIHKPFAATAAGDAEITQVLEPKTRRLFICRFLSRRNDTHSRAVQPSVFLNAVIPLSISFSHSLLRLDSSCAFVVFWGSFGVVSLRVVSLGVAAHCMAL